MPTIGSHTFSVIVNGRTLHECEPPPDEVTGESGEKKAVYIEAVEGAKFEIRSELRGPLSFPTGHLGVHLHLDDIHMNGHPVEKSRYNRYRGDSYVFRNVVYLDNQTWLSRDFQFSNLVTTDAVPKTADLKKLAQYAGTIRLSLYDMTAPKSDATHQQWKPPSKTAIPEKALNGRPVDMATDLGKQHSPQNGLKQQDKTLLAAACQSVCSSIDRERHCKCWISYLLRLSRSHCMRETQTHKFGRGS